MTASPSSAGSQEKPRSSQEGPSPSPADSPEPGEDSPGTARGILSRKVLFVLLLVSGTMALLGGGVQLFLDYQRDLEEVERDFDLVEKSILEGLSNSLWVFDRQQIDIQLDGILRIGRFSYLSLNIAESGQVLEKGLPPQGRIMERHFQISHHFKGQNVALGDLYLVADLDTLQDRQWSRAITLLLVGLASIMVLAFVLHTVLRRLITRPLERLVDYAAALDSWSQPPQPPLLERPFSGWLDEIDLLITALTQSQRRLAGANADLASLNQELEALVEERTHALQQSEQRYRQLFERNKAVELLIDPKDGRILNANKAAENFYGYSLERLQQMRISDINIHSPEEIQHEMTLAEEEQRDYFLFRHRLASGEIRDVEVHSGPIELEQGRVFLYSIIHDITERRRAEANLQTTLDELTRSNSELERFAYVASHDLQEPVRSVISYAQLLDRRYGDQLDAEGREFLDFLVSGAKRMGDLVRDLLSYSRITNRASPFEPVDMETTLATIQDNLRLAIEESGAVISVSPLPAVQGDRIQLGELMQNLLHNAIKFRHQDKPPQITITAQAAETEGLVEFIIRDQGIGIDPSYHDQIFVIFKRLHPADQYPGTGIGLALCKRIVERHGGQIWVESLPGEGTTFHLTLPRAKSLAQTSGPDSNTRGPKT